MSFPFPCKYNQKYLSAFNGLTLIPEYAKVGYLFTVICWNTGCLQQNEFQYANTLNTAMVVNEIPKLPL